MSGRINAWIGLDDLNGVGAYQNDGKIVAYFVDPSAAVVFRTPDVARGFIAMLQRALDDDRMEHMRPDDAPAEGETR